MTNKFHSYYMNLSPNERFDYDLSVIDPRNEDSTSDEIRECICDALSILSERISDD